MIILNKKSQGLSLNTVVIAALVVLVLVILAAILMGRLDIFTGHLRDCPGTCMQSESFSEEVCRDGYEKIPGQCEEDNHVCCAPTGEDVDEGGGHRALG